MTKENFKCESCGGEVRFDPEVGALICEYCGSRAEGSIKNEESTAVVLEKDYSSGLSFSANDDKTKIYYCSSCSAASIINSNSEPLKRCASCGSRDVVLGNKSTIHPDGVVPFKISKTEAASIFRKWISDRKFSPNDLKKMARLEKISGLYVPAYSFDFTTHVSFSATCTNEVKDREGNVIREDSYRERGQYDEHTEGFNLSASEVVSTRVLRGIGVFNYGENIPYSVDYLLGFSALDAGKNVHEAYREMEEIIHDSYYNEVRSKLNLKYDDVSFLKVNTTIINPKVKFLYLPMWANHYKYKGKDYHVFINGQSGEVDGKAPKSFWKILFLVFGIVAVLGGVFGLVHLLKG